MPGKAIWRIPSACCSTSADGTGAALDGGVVAGSVLRGGWAAWPGTVLENHNGWDSPRQGPSLTVLAIAYISHQVVTNKVVFSLSHQGENDLDIQVQVIVNDTIP